MTTYSRREIVTRRIEYGLATGRAISDFEKVKAIAFADFCARKGVEPAAFISAPDHWAVVESRDDEVVITFQVETKEG